MPSSISKENELKETNEKQLKEQLSKINSEIQNLQVKLGEDILKVSNFEIDLFAQFGINERLKIIQEHFKSGKEPNKATIFLVLTVLELLRDGHGEERDIKFNMLNKCREIGVKYSTRGNILGTNADVGIVCNVLSCLGILETENPTNSSGSLKSKTRSPNVKTVEKDLQSHEITENFAKALCSMVSDRWKTALKVYITEAKKEKSSILEMHPATNSTTNQQKNETKIVSHEISKTPNQTDTASDKPTKLSHTAPDPSHISSNSSEIPTDFSLCDLLEEENDIELINEDKSNVRTKNDDQHPADHLSDIFNFAQEGRRRADSSTPTPSRVSFVLHDSASDSEEEVREKGGGLHLLQRMSDASTDNSEFAHGLSFNKFHRVRRLPGEKEEDHERDTDDGNKYANPFDDEYSTHGTSFSHTNNSFYTIDSVSIGSHDLDGDEPGKAELHVSQSSHNVSESKGPKIKTKSPESSLNASTLFNASVDGLMRTPDPVERGLKLDPMHSEAISDGNDIDDQGDLQMMQMIMTTLGGSVDPGEVNEVSTPGRLIPTKDPSVLDTPFVHPELSDPSAVDKSIVPCPSNNIMSTAPIVSEAPDNEKKAKPDQSSQCYDQNYLRSLTMMHDSYDSSPSLKLQSIQQSKNTFIGSSSDDKASNPLVIESIGTSLDTQKALEGTIEIDSPIIDNPTSLPNQKALPKRGSGSHKTWKVVNIPSSVANSASKDAQFAIFDPSDVLSKWSHVSNEEAMLRSREERLIRRLAGQCNMPIRFKPLRVGERYLNRQLNPSLICDERENYILWKRKKMFLPFDDYDYYDTVDKHPLQSTHDNGTHLMESEDNVESEGGCFVTERESMDRTAVGSEAAAATASYKELDSPSQGIIITATTLLEKVRKSKRQRGFNMTATSFDQNAKSNSTGPTANLYVTTHLNRISALVNKSSSSQWKQRQITEASMTFSEKPVVMDNTLLYKQHFTTIDGPFSDPGTVLNGLHPPFPNAYSKHFSIPIVLTSSDVAMPRPEQFSEDEATTRLSVTSHRAMPSNPIAMPDLTVYTNELPWKQVAKEFQLISLDDMGVNSASAAAAASFVGQIGGFTPTSAPIIPYNNAFTSPPRKYSFSSEKDNNHEEVLQIHATHLKKQKKSQSLQFSNSIEFVESSYVNGDDGLHSVNHDLKWNQKGLVQGEESDRWARSSSLSFNPSILSRPDAQVKFSEVLAPNFHEFENVLNEPDRFTTDGNDPQPTATTTTSRMVTDTSGSHEEEKALEEVDEDISDQAVLERHEQVLRNMREKWALMHQLKLQLRKEYPTGSMGMMTNNNNNIPVEKYSQNIIRNGAARQRDACGGEIQEETMVQTIAGEVSKGLLNDNPSSVTNGSSMDPPPSISDRMEASSSSAATSVLAVYSNGHPVRKRPNPTKKRGRPPKVSSYQHSFDKHNFPSPRDLSSSMPPIG